MVPESLGKTPFNFSRRFSMIIVPIFPIDFVGACQQKLFNFFIFFQIILTFNFWDDFFNCVQDQVLQLEKIAKYLSIVQVSVSRHNCATVLPIKKSRFSSESLQFPLRIIKDEV